MLKLSRPAGSTIPPLTKEQISRRKLENERIKRAQKGDFKAAITMERALLGLRGAHFIDWKR
jgi:hypothetical protein